MTLVDALLILIVIGSIVLGYRKGFIGQLSSIVSWVVAIVLCYKCGELAQSIFLAFVPSAAQWPLSSITVKTVSLAFAFLLVMVVLGAGLSARAEVFSASTAQEARAKALEAFDVCALSMEYPDAGAQQGQGDLLSPQEFALLLQPGAELQADPGRQHSGEKDGRRQIVL